MVDEVENWEIEAVLAERTKGRQREVLVKWLGAQGEASTTWEPADNVPKSFLDEFSGQKASGREERRGKEGNRRR